MKEIQLAKEARPLRRKMLSEDEARLMAQRLKQVMGQPFVDLTERYEVADILLQSMHLLGLKTWFGRWRKANPGVVDRLRL